MTAVDKIMKYYTYLALECQEIEVDIKKKKNYDLSDAFYSN